MKYCRYCGTQLDDNAAFCSNCGAKTPEQMNGGRPDTAKKAETQYSAPPQPNTTARKVNWKAVIIAAVIVALLAAGGVVLSHFLNKPDEPDDMNGPAKPEASQDNTKPEKNDEAGKSEQDKPAKQDVYDNVDVSVLVFDKTTGTITGCDERDVTEIIIPAEIDGVKVTSIGDEALAYRGHLKSVIVANGVTEIGEGAIKGCGFLKSVTLPDSVTSIGDYAFCACIGLTEFTIPDGVTSIGNGLFGSCGGLISITIPDGVTSIGDQAFCGCARLTSVTIPDNVRSIGDEAFAYCESLTSVAIPKSVTSIGTSAFKECAFSDVYYGGSVAEWNNIQIGEDNDALFNAVIHFAETGEEAYTISKKELEAQIEEIRECFYNPTANDSKVVLPKGTSGWDYSREYYYRDNKLMFAFIYKDSSDEHRLYFKDDHMIRYIDESHQTYDYPDTERFSRTWEQPALDEAYSVAGMAASARTDSKWLGTWTAATGESLEIYYVSDAGLSLVFNKRTEQGNMMSVDYEMEFDDTDKTVASEIGDQEKLSGWEYKFVLGDGYITVKSRYPDEVYYKS